MVTVVAGPRHLEPETSDFPLRWLPSMASGPVEFVPKVAVRQSSGLAGKTGAEGWIVTGPAIRAAEPVGPWDWPRSALLLIEDDPGDALLVEELLADSGLDLELRWVRSLAEAEPVLKASVVQCVLLDLHLPDAQGLEALARVVNMSPAASIVVLTGLAEESVGLAAVAAGAQDYLIKGAVEGELFARSIRYAVQRKQTEQAAAALQAGLLRAQENARLERGLLPSPVLSTADLSVVARYRPGREQALIGGDFYDVVETGDGTVHALIGDVSGHGPDEAALGVCLRIAWRTLVMAGVAGEGVLRMMERILIAERSASEIFATVTTLALDVDRRHVRVLRAGHPGLLLRNPGAPVELVETTVGPALGLIPGLARWSAGELTLTRGASVVLFTDGLFEGRTGPHERLGEDGLLALARTHDHRAAADFVDRLIADAEALAAPAGGLADDVAVVHLNWSTTT